MSSPDRARLARVQSIHRGAEGIELFAKLKIMKVKTEIETNLTISNLLCKIEI
jgi:hypothetical protein